MAYVYILQSIHHTERFYVGTTQDIERRLLEHNTGKSHYTSRHRPWKLVVSIWFSAQDAALNFEKYLKSGSGRAFAKRHFPPD